MVLLKLFITQRPMLTNTFSRYSGTAQGGFKNPRKSRSRRGNEAEVFFAPKSASLRRRLPCLNSSWGRRFRVDLFLAGVTHQRFHRTPVRHSIMLRSPAFRARMARALARLAPYFCTENCFHLWTYGRGLQWAVQNDFVMTIFRTPMIPEAPLRRSICAQSRRVSRPCLRKSCR